MLLTIFMLLERLKIPSISPGGSPQNLTATGELKDMYVLKLLANGNFRWVKQIVSATNNPEKAQQISYNNTNGKIYFGGVIYGKTDLNPSPAIADTFFLFFKCGWKFKSSFHL